MDNHFIVSARKYRPQTFDTVIGQQHITTTLKNAIVQDHLAHAFLFCGPRGVGKTTCARILAKTINCESRSADGEACNECNSCTSFNNGSSLNIHELDAASNNSVDDIRALVDQVRFAPQAGKYKVYIIDEVHMLSASAFNAFLKTLEEPPSYAIFILATTEKHKILPTILSRCQLFDFKRITSADTVEHLRSITQKENITADQAALQLIAQKSEGCMRDALSIMDKIVSFTSGHLDYSNTLEHLNILDEDYYFQLLDCMLTQNATQALLLFDAIYKKGFEGDVVINGFAAFIRNVLVSKEDHLSDILEVVESFKQRYKEAASKTPTAILISALSILSDGEVNFRMAKNKKLHVELILIKLCFLMQAIEMSNAGGELRKKKIVDSNAVLPYRNISPIAFPAKKQAKAKPIQSSEYMGGAKLVVQESPDLENLPKPEKQSEKENKVLSKLSSVEKLRQQFKAAQPVADTPITQESLELQWQALIQFLKEDKSAATQSFVLSSVKMIDDNSFYIYTNDNIQYRFIENSKVLASEFLQEKLNNKGLQFYIIKEENKNLVLNEPQKPLSTVERYQLLVQQYPLVHELKIKLNLQLEQ